MIRFSMSLILCASILGFAISTAAHQPVDGDIHATFGWLAYQTHTLDHYWRPQALVAPGLIAEGDLNSHGGLEISMFYLQNAFSVKQDGRVVTERVKRVYIATGYRHWLNRKFSVALAFSSSYAMGDPRPVADDFPLQTKPPTSASDTTEYGMDLSLQYEPWRKDRVGFVLDARYGYSVTAKRHEDSNHYGVMLAFKYFVQSRMRAPK